MRTLIRRSQSSGQHGRLQVMCLLLGVVLLSVGSTETDPSTRIASTPTAALKPINQAALQTMVEGGIRRLPVLDLKGILVGVISMDDVLLKAQPGSLGSKPALSTEEVVRAYRAINQRQVPQVVLAHGAAA